MADSVVLECKSRKADPSSSSESEPDEQEVQEKVKRLAEEKERKMLEDEQRRIKRRIERKRKPEEGSSSSSSQQPESVHNQFEKIMNHLKEMRMDCDICKKLETPKSQMDYLKAIYSKVTAIEKLLKNQ